MHDLVFQAASAGDVSLLSEYHKKHLWLYRIITIGLP